LRRQSLLAEIEAKRRGAATRHEIEVLDAELTLASEDTGYNPYDRPGPAKPLDVEIGVTVRLKALKRRRRP
jgi:hypothetical protein